MLIAAAGLEKIYIWILIFFFIKKSFFFLLLWNKKVSFGTRKSLEMVTE